MAKRKVAITANLGENDYDPSEFVEATVFAEELGFTTAWFGDHIFPWYHSGKRSSYVWSVMPVALERTTRIKVGPFVTVPTGARYHPAIIAQAAATLDNMYPGRIMIGAGSGEALNERPFWNGTWPNWEERMNRLTEGIELIQKLWNSKKPFRFESKYFSSDFYFLYTKPRRKIPIFISAIGKKAAFRSGMNSDGLITIAPRNNVQKLKDEILPAYKEGRQKSMKTGSGKICIELAFTFQDAREIVKNSWRTLGIMNKDSWSLPDPIAVEKAGRNITAEDVKSKTHICKTWNDVVKVIEQYVEIGVNEISIYTGCNEKFLKDISKNLLSVF
jgi:coenzyme F420-dependent glucose-6-phosphate dehydrogenase